MPKRSETLDEINERTRKKIAEGIGRVRDAARQGDNAAVATLDEGVKELIRELPATERNGKYAQLKRARETEPAPAGELEQTADYGDEIAGLVIQAAEEIVQGTQRDLKRADIARRVARIIVTIRFRMPNASGNPDLLAKAFATRAASHDLYETAAKRLPGDAETVERQVDGMMRAVQNVMSEVRTDMLRGLDTDKAEAKRFQRIIKAAGRGVTASEAVATHYDLPLKSKNEISREKYRAGRDTKAARKISAKVEDGHPVEKSVMAIQQLAREAKTKASDLEPHTKSKLKSHVDATIVDLMAVRQELAD